MPTLDRDTLPEAERDALERTWRPPPGFVGWLSQVNHRAIGKRYLVTGIVFFLLAGLDALRIRLQLASADGTLMSADAYNAAFTMHGTTMMFLFAVPIMEGVGIYLVPLMIGARDMALPRLNAFGYWVYLIAGVSLYAAYFVGYPPTGGWFAYPPLTRSEYSPDPGLDFWATMITFIEIAALVAAVELIVTIFKQRAPGMSLNRMPVLVWAVLVMAFMIVFAMPPLMVASVMLALDRTFSTHFFNPLYGGEPLLWQHVFWFFGHPDVYIIMVPAFGILSMVFISGARRRIVGYPAVVLSLVAIGFLSFGLWVHHMFATGLPMLGMSFFSAASMMIAIPSGVLVFCWIATLWNGRARLNTALLFAAGALITFVMGGVTGVMLASVPFDLQVHDTFFVVAHFHYVLFGGVVFPLFAGFFHWYPKVVGRTLSERLGKISFVLIFLGFHLTFFPQHQLGFMGMPRRIFTYLPDLGWDSLNLLSTVGAFVVAAGVLVLVYNLVVSSFAGEAAPDNPWDADSLEWATSSPPPNYNFAIIPAVRGRYALWEDPTVAGEVTRELRSDRRETPGARIVDAEPESRIALPGPTLIPLFTALAVGFTFLGLVASPWLVPIGAVLSFICIVAWTWPREWSLPSAGRLPVTLNGAKSPVWWGMVLLIVIETTVFATLFSSYLYLRFTVPEWPPEGIPNPDLLLPIINTGVLFASSVAVFWGSSGLAKGDLRRLKIGIGTGILLEVVFLAIKILLATQTPYGFTDHAYGSIFSTIDRLHSAHVVVAILMASVALVLALRGYFNEDRKIGVQAVNLYWQFVAIIWIPVFFILFFVPRWF